MVTSLYTALLAIMYIALTVCVVRARIHARVAIGDAENMLLRSRIRAHANFAEYAPFFVVMLALVEVGGLPNIGLHLLGIAFLAGRSMHAYSLLKHERYDGTKLTTKPLWRTRGVLLTLIIYAVLAAILFWQFVSSL